MTGMDNENQNDKLIKACLNALKLKGYSHNTLFGYSKDLDSFFKVVDKDALTLDYKTINSYFLNLMSENKAPRTIARHMAALRCLYKFLLKNEYVDSDPTVKLESPKLAKRLPSYLLDEQVHLIMDAMKCLRDRCILALLYSSGMRLNELWQLNRVDVNWDKKEIKVFGKGSKERITPFNEECKLLLKQYLEERKDENIALFVSIDGTRVGKRYIQKTLKERAESVGITGVHPHLLRHSLASRLCQNDVPIQEIQEILGHESIQTTTMYSHLNNTKIRNSYNRVYEDKKD
jgi:integrase/recombinase XerD